MRGTEAAARAAGEPDAMLSVKDVVKFKVAPCSQAIANIQPVRTLKGVCHDCCAAGAATKGLFKAQCISCHCKQAVDFKLPKATAPEGSSNRSLSLEDEAGAANPKPQASNVLPWQELLCEPVTVSHLSLSAADPLSLIYRLKTEAFFD